MKESIVERELAVVYAVATETQTQQAIAIAIGQ